MELLHGLKKVQKIINPDSGVYLLEIFASSDFYVSKTKFKDIFFHTGFYYYAGSAQKNLSRRISRHVSKSKKLFWHVDYLLNTENTRINRIVIIPNALKNHECFLIEQLQPVKKIIHPAEKFGSSDCSNCKSHLLYSKVKLKLDFILQTTGGFLFPFDKRNTPHK